MTFLGKRHMEPSRDHQTPCIHWCPNVFFPEGFGNRCQQPDARKTWQ